MACGCGTYSVTTTHPCNITAEVCHGHYIDITPFGTALQIVTPPVNGTATILPNGNIRYDHAGLNFDGDPFVYQFANGNGTGTCTVGIKILEGIPENTKVIILTASGECEVGNPTFEWDLPECAQLYPGYTINDNPIKVIVPVYDPEFPDATCEIKVNVCCDYCNNCCKCENYTWQPPSIVEECGEDPEFFCEAPCTYYNPITGNCDGCPSGTQCCDLGEGSYTCRECCSTLDCPANQVCIAGNCGCPPGTTLNQYGACCPISVPSCAVCDANGNIVPNVNLDCDPETEVIDYATCACVCAEGLCFDAVTQQCVVCPPCTPTAGRFSVSNGTANYTPYSPTCPACKQCVACVDCPGGFQCNQNPCAPKSLCKGELVDTIINPLPFVSYNDPCTGLLQTCSEEQPCCCKKVPPVVVLKYMCENGQCYEVNDCLGQTCYDTLLECQTACIQTTECQVAGQHICSDVLLEQEAISFTITNGAGGTANFFKRDTNSGAWTSVGSPYTINSNNQVFTFYVNNGLAFSIPVGGQLRMVTTNCGEIVVTRLNCQNPPPSESRACCLSNSTCQNLSSEDCASANGIHYPNNLCADNVCTPSLNCQYAVSGSTDCSIDSMTFSITNGVGAFPKVYKKNTANDQYELAAVLPVLTVNHPNPFVVTYSQATLLYQSIQVGGSLKLEVTKSGCPTLEKVLIKQPCECEVGLSGQFNCPNNYTATITNAEGGTVSVEKRDSSVSAWVPVGTSQTIPSNPWTWIVDANTSTQYNVPVGGAIRLTVLEGGCPAQYLTIVKEPCNVNCNASLGIIANCDSNIGTFQVNNAAGATFTLYSRNNTNEIFTSCLTGTIPSNSATVNANWLNGNCAIPIGGQYKLVLSNLAVGCPDLEQTLTRPPCDPLPTNCDAQITPEFICNNTAKFTANYALGYGAGLYKRANPSLPWSFVESLGTIGTDFAWVQTFNVLQFTYNVPVGGQLMVRLTKVSCQTIEAIVTRQPCDVECNNTITGNFVCIHDVIFTIDNAENRTLMLYKRAGNTGPYNLVGSPITIPSNPYTITLNTGSGPYQIGLGGQIKAVLVSNGTCPTIEDIVVKQSCPAPSTIVNCCISGNCSQVTISQCNNQSGVIWPSQELCAANCQTNNPIPLWCCNNGNCIEVETQEQCQNLGGVPYALQSDCNTNCIPPVQPATGACCISGECYSNYTETNCLASNGIYAGDFIDCSGYNCAEGCPDITITGQVTQDGTPTSTKYIYVPAWTNGASATIV